MYPKLSQEVIPLLAVERCSIVKVFLFAFARFTKFNEPCFSLSEVRLLSKKIEFPKCKINAFRFLRRYIAIRNHGLFQTSKFIYILKIFQLWYHFFLRYDFSFGGWFKRFASNSDFINNKSIEKIIITKVLLISKNKKTLTIKKQVSRHSDVWTINTN